MTAGDPWYPGGTAVGSRLMLGTAQYPSPASLSQAVRAAGAEVLTVSVRRETAGGGDGGDFWRLIEDLGVHVLPNTAGCVGADQAMRTAHLARELFETSWIKLEVVGDEETQHPDPFGLVDAARQLVDDGFTVFPYTTEDQVLADRLVDAGCDVLMPWGAPIGTGKGLANPAALARLRARHPERTLVVDAGLGLPSHAGQAMELGYDAVLVNTAVAKAGDPAAMAAAFARAVEAGRLGSRADPMPERSMTAPTTPLVGVPFWHEAGVEGGSGGG